MSVPTLPPPVEVATTIAPAWVDTDGASAYTAIATSTLETMRVRGDGPRYRKIGRSVRYKIADLDCYMEAQPAGGGRA